MRGGDTHRFTTGERTRSSRLCAMAATDKEPPPQPANATWKDAQLSRVPWSSMLLVIAQYNLAVPCTDNGRAKNAYAEQAKVGVPPLWAGARPGRQGRGWRHDDIVYALFFASVSLSGKIADSAAAASARVGGVSAN